MQRHRHGRTCERAESHVTRSHDHVAPAECIALRVLTGREGTQSVCEGVAIVGWFLMAIEGAHGDGFTEAAHDARAERWGPMCSRFCCDGL
jgi:hypothetical protein